MKNQVVFQSDKEFPIDLRTVMKGKTKMESLHRSYRRNGYKHFSTHRSFIEDVVKKINEAPSVRIKKLVI